MNKTYNDLTAQQKRRFNNIMMIRSTGGVAGNIAGAYFAYKKNLGFWGYVGHILLGGLVIGGLTYIATMPAAGKLLNEAETKTDTQTKTVK
jgi:hypothetical protein